MTNGVVKMAVALTALCGVSACDLDDIVIDTPNERGGDDVFFPGDGGERGFGRGGAEVGYVCDDRRRFVAYFGRGFDRVTVETEDNSYDLSLAERDGDLRFYRGRRGDDVVRLYVEDDRGELRVEDGRDYVDCLSAGRGPFEGGFGGGGFDERERRKDYGREVTFSCDGGRGFTVAVSGREGLLQAEGRTFEIALVEEESDRDQRYFRGRDRGDVARLLYRRNGPSELTIEDERDFYGCYTR